MIRIPFTISFKFNANSPRSSPFSRMAAVLPRFNRALLFATTGPSFHGFPRPLACPSDRRACPPGTSCRRARSTVGRSRDSSASSPTRSGCQGTAREPSRRRKGPLRFVHFGVKKRTRRCERYPTGPLVGSQQPRHFRGAAHEVEKKSNKPREEGTIVAQACCQADSWW